MPRASAMAVQCASCSSLGVAKRGSGSAAEFFVFCFAVAMIRQKFQLGANLILLEKIEDARHWSRRSALTPTIVGMAHNERQALVTGAADVLQDQRIVDAGECVMLARIDVLDIDENRVHLAQGWRHLRVVKIPAGFDRQRKPSGL